MAGLPGGGLNLAFEAVDRHAQGPAGQRVALRRLDRDGSSHDISFHELSNRTNRFAHALQCLGVAPGARLFVLCERGLELNLGLLGGLKHGLDKVIGSTAEHVLCQVPTGILAVGVA